MTRVLFSRVVYFPLLLVRLGELNVDNTVEAEALYRNEFMKVQKINNNPLTQFCHSKSITSRPRI